MQYKMITEIVSVVRVTVDAQSAEHVQLVYRSRSQMALEVSLID